MSLNDGELRFVRLLKEYCAAYPAEFEDKPLFLLRNMSRGRGIGFFEAGNFYLDFILWRLDGGKQRITFVDPKGIRRLSWANESKLDFYKTIRDVETRLGDADVSLRSFIVSVTPAAEIALLGRGRRRHGCTQHPVRRGQALRAANDPGVFA